MGCRVPGQSPCCTMTCCLVSDSPVAGCQPSTAPGGLCQLHPWAVCWGVGDQGLLARRAASQEGRQPGSRMP